MVKSGEKALQRCCIYRNWCDLLDKNKHTHTNTHTHTHIYIYIRRATKEKSQTYTISLARGATVTLVTLELLVPKQHRADCKGNGVCVCLCVCVCVCVCDCEKWWCCSVTPAVERTGSSISCEGESQLAEKRSALRHNKNCHRQWKPIVMHNHTALVNKLAPPKHMSAT